MNKIGEKNQNIYIYIHTHLLIFCLKGNLAFRVRLKNLNRKQKFCKIKKMRHKACYPVDIVVMSCKHTAICNVVWGSSVLHTAYTDVERGCRGNISHILSKPFYQRLLSAQHPPEWSCAVLNPTSHFHGGLLLVQAGSTSKKRVGWTQVHHTSLVLVSAMCATHRDDNANT